MGEGAVSCGADDCFRIFRSSNHDGKSGYLFAAITVRDKKLLVESVCIRLFTLTHIPSVIIV